MQHFVEILNADYKTQQLLFVCMHSMCNSFLSCLFHILYKYRIGMALTATYEKANESESYGSTLDFEDLKQSCKQILTITALQKCLCSIILYYQIIEHYLFKKREGKNESSLSRNIYLRLLILKTNRIVFSKLTLQWIDELLMSMISWSFKLSLSALEYVRYLNFNSKSYNIGI